jgi:hypothetical protein
LEEEERRFIKEDVKKNYRRRRHFNCVFILRLLSRAVPSFWQSSFFFFFRFE